MMVRDCDDEAGFAPAAVMLRRLVPAITVMLLVLVGSPVGVRAETTVTDAAGRTVAIGDTRRIVSIGGAVTEILYALGRERDVVAVDTTSLYPPAALTEKPNVGYMRQLSPEGVLALSPSLVLAAEGAGPPEAIAVLEAAKVPFVLVPDRFTPDGIVDKVRRVAEAVGEGARGACLIEAIEQDFAALTRERARSGKPARVLFVLSFAGDRAMVAGTDTAADGIIRLAGAENAMADLKGYKPVGDEAILAAAPDAILMMERPGQTLSADTVLARPAFATTPAGAQKNLISMDGLYLLGFGPRTALAAGELAARLRPGAEPETLSARHAAAIERCRR